MDSNLLRRSLIQSTNNITDEELNRYTNLIWLCCLYGLYMYRASLERFLFLINFHMTEKSRIPSHNNTTIHLVLIEHRRIWTPWTNLFESDY